MLARLMKHEILSSYRKFLPIYAGVILMTLITSFSYNIQSISATLTFTGLLLTLVGITMLFTFYTIIINLGQRVFGKPGYLLFTTPATSIEIMVSKVLINMMWFLVSILVSIFAASLFILNAFQQNIFDILGELFGLMSRYPYETFTIITAGIIYAIYVIGMLFFLFALLNMIYKGEKKILIGILLYFAISQATSLVSSIFLGAYMSLSTAVFEDFNSIWVFVGIYFVLSVAFYIMTYFIIDRKLELQ
ncbi:hypothetical protein N7548_03300 [Acholeplasma manati]|uniref:ABC transporter permease n=1 Tax=Paracholeplasma manati TaxID=591373 RepID=A0ABT2Y541_9MOLU|nr:hypothetical protein [Paracholeplasma manati]MCV2231848.1 hypothetical protein [Paracholeplasma manati]